MAIAPDQIRRPRDLSQIIDGAISLYRRNFGELLAISAVNLPGPLLIAIASIAVGDWGTELIVITALLYIPIIALTFIVSAAIARAIADIADGLPADFNRAYRQVFARLGALALAELRVLGITSLIFAAIAGVAFVTYLWMGNTLLTYAPIGGMAFAIYLWIRWAFVTQAVVIEGTNSRDALSLSADIVKGSWWRTLGILLVVGLLVAVASGALSLILVLVPHEASTLLNAVVGVIVTPFGVIASTLLFFDLQSREREHVSIA